MNIAVIGAGAIGSLVAGLLTKAEIDCVLIGKEDQVNVINRHGLTIEGFKGKENVKVKALNKLDKEYELVIFTTKTQDLEQAYQANCEFLDSGFVMSSQNGVQGDSILGVHYDKDKMFSSIVMFGATYTKTGVVVYNFPGDWIIGRPYTPLDPKTHEIVEVLGKAFTVKVSEDIIGMKYLKLFVNFNNCIPALIGKSMQETFADLDLCRLSILLLKEGVNIVQKANIEIVSMPEFPVDRIYGLVNMPIEQAAGIINKTLTSLSNEPLYGSILQSIIRKRKSEIEFINGEVVSLAKQMRMQAPLNERAVEMVNEIEQKGKFFDINEVKEKFNLKKAVISK